MVEAVDRMVSSPLRLPELLLSLRQLTVATSFQNSVYLGFCTFWLLTSLVPPQEEKFLASVVKLGMFSTLCSVALKVRFVYLGLQS